MSEDYDPDLAHADDLDEGGFYRWRLSAEFSVRLDEGQTLKAVVHMDEGDPGAGWAVELYQAGAFKETVADGQAADMDAGKADAMAALQRNGYVARPGAR